MEHAYYEAGRRQTFQEMRQKQASYQETFFSVKNDSHGYRPSSVATEFVDTDWDEDDIISEPGDNSPRASLQSGQPSFTTVSTYDEAPTPRSSRSRDAYFGMTAKPVEGPRGPHLFRLSTDSSFNEDLVLTLSPITPKAPRGYADLRLVKTPLPLARHSSPFEFAREELNTATLASWTPEMVAQSMLNAGIELSMAERFIENDINGAILITLKFEDLRELDIQSFGIRTKVWHQIQALRDSRPASPKPSTPIEDAPSREAKKDTRHGEEPGLRRRQSSRRQRRPGPSSDTILPGDSVSIIGIEQVIPKPHHCSKGENCSKWRKQQKTLEQFRRANPHVDITAGGTVMILGDAGNPETARSIDPNQVHRPVSDAVPSVVASSDILGPGELPPLQYLQEAMLRDVQSRDAQDNVRQFLAFQTQNNVNEVPPTPPFQVPASPQSPHHGLRRLPKLSIPQTPQTPRRTITRPSTVPPPQTQHDHQYTVQHAVQHEFVPHAMEKSDPRSPDLETPRNPYRFGTPFSEMDVPVTAVPIGPISRDVSQSVPPNMNYHHNPATNAGGYRSQSRASARRPSFPVLPALDENRPIRGLGHTVSAETSPRASARPHHQPLQPPSRANYPWSPIERSAPEQFFTAPEAPAQGEAPTPGSASSASSNGITHQGPMKKRKTKLLRHEWQDGYFTLKGTRLNMHKDGQKLDRTLEYVDIDDYAIACSSAASTSKLSAAFKAVHISHNREKSDPVGAFSFQLIPQGKDGTRLRKRYSSIQSTNGAGEGVNGTGKTHHFAVTSRDDRIDWMRELMLAKALKQKGEGFEISVNGSMI
jgi:hypothetical protein